MSDKQDAPQDPLEMLRRMWSGAGIPLPGMVVPTVDMDELDKRIKDLRTVENWLKMNLGMLQATVQGLEVQRSTLAALKSMSEQRASAADDTAAAPDNPFANPMWPWNLMQGAATAPPAPDPAPAPRPSSRKSK